MNQTMSPAEQLRLAKSPKARTVRWIRKNWQMITMIVIPFAYIFVFCYVPMYGAQIAFKDYKAADGIWGSQWVGLKHFIAFFDSYLFWRVIRNTLVISFYSLLVGTPIPIILAIALNCAGSAKFRKTVQLVTYAPHFISTVVLIGMLTQLLSPKYGLINTIIVACGGKAIDFMSRGRMFPHLYVWSGIWQSMGYSAIIYISALSGIDPSLHEAAIVDGAGRLKRIWHIDLPGIAPTIIILLIMSAGNLMNVSYEKVLLMQNSTNTEYSEVIATLVYKQGLTASFPNYSYSSAIGLFNSAINFILVILVNAVAKKFSGSSLW